MTTVCGPVVRSVGFDSFADLVPDVPVTKIGADGIEFDGDLTPEQVDAVHARVTSVDDADQARRATLAAHRDANAARIAELTPPATEEPDPTAPPPEPTDPAVALEMDLRQQLIDLIDAALRI